MNLVFTGMNMRRIADTMGYSEGYTRKKKYDCKKLLLEMIKNDPKYQELIVTTEKE